MIRVCLVSQEYPPETGWGGIGTYTRHLAHGLAQAGHRVEVISRTPEGAAPGCQWDGPVRIRRVAPMRIPVRGRRFVGRSTASLEFARAVDHALRRIDRPDVIEVPNWNAEGLWHLARRGRVAPVAVRVHSPYAAVAASRGERLTMDKRLAMTLERAAVRRADLVVTHSAYNARVAADLYGLDLAAIPIVPHGIPLPVEDPEPGRRQGHRLLYVGRLERRKGIQAMVEALPAVLDANPEVRVVLAGQDFPTAPGGVTWREHAECLLSPTQQARVRFAGHVEESELERLYRESDLFVAPSLYESFGLVYLEAMSRGLPVIGCRVAAIPEVVAHGETGLLVPPGDAPALAQAITSLLRDEAARAEMGARGRDTVKRLFTVEAMASRVADLYTRLAERKRALR